MRCLVTGATGYIGGRLAPRLLGAVAPFHAVVFGGMARNIARGAEQAAGRLSRPSGRR